MNAARVLGSTLLGPQVPIVLEKHHMVVPRPLSTPGAAYHTTKSTLQHTLMYRMRVLVFSACSWSGVLSMPLIQAIAASAGTFRTLSPARHSHCPRINMLRAPRHSTRSSSKHASRLTSFTSEGCPTACPSPSDAIPQEDAIGGVKKDEDVKRLGVAKAAQGCECCISCFARHSSKVIQERGTITCAQVLAHMYLCAW